MLLTRSHACVLREQKKDIYIYIEREREGERGGGLTVNIHVAFSIS